VAFGDERADLIDQPRDLRGVLRLPFDDQLVSLGPDADVEKRFEVAEVFVVGPEEGLDCRLRDGYLALRYRWDFLSPFTAVIYLTGS
jgi:hypothetical protein